MLCTILKLLPLKLLPLKFGCAGRVLELMCSQVSFSSNNASHGYATHLSAKHFSFHCLNEYPVAPPHDGSGCVYSS